MTDVRFSFYFHKTHGHIQKQKLQTKKHLKFQHHTPKKIEVSDTPGFFKAES
jgi:hypothetical protein